MTQSHPKHPEAQGGRALMSLVPEKQPALKGLPDWGAIKLDTLFLDSGNNGTGTQSLPFPCPLAESPLAQVHLQWFAAEDEGRTEDPTDQKMRKAREDGKVAKSPEVTGALVLLLPMIALIFLMPWIMGKMVEMVSYYFSQINSLEPEDGGLLMYSFMNWFLPVFLPVALIAFIAAAMGNLLQVGFLFTTKPITPDLSKIRPKVGEWAKKSFLSGEAYFNLFKSFLKVIVIGVAAYININSEINRLINLNHVTLGMALGLIGDIALRIILQSAIILLALALPDYLFQRWKHRESLKMTVQEVKEERRQAEGDPMVRARLREKMRSLLSQNVVENVAKSDVVITNPTHYAVALQWESSRMEAPVMTAKGQDETALRIRTIAQENSVPLVENRPLARALHSSVEVGDYIPEEYWEAVSRILAEIYRMNGKLDNVG